LPALLSFAALVPGALADALAAMLVHFNALVAEYLFSRTNSRIKIIPESTHQSHLIAKTNSRIKNEHYELFRPGSANNDGVHVKANRSVPVMANIKASFFVGVLVVTQMNSGGASSCPDHPLSTMCRHRLVMHDPSDSTAKRNESCAAAQLLNQASLAWRSLETSGTRTSELQKAHNQIATSMLSPELQNSAPGLFAATGRVLGVSAYTIQAACNRTNRETDTLDGACFDGTDPKRAKRVDAYPLDHVYAFFHVHEPHDESTPSLPDYSAFIQLDKNKRGRWKKKALTLEVETDVLGA